MNTQHRGRVDGLLAVTCWCERTITAATAAEVAAGVTRSCGRRRCSEQVLVAS